MRFLLDTVTLLWIGGEPERLSQRSVDLLGDADNDFYISAVSCWEIQMKIRSGKLSELRSIERLLPPLVESHAASLLAFGASAAGRLAGLPIIHKDPFDLMLICHALDQGLTILTPDETIRRYPVATDW